MSTSKGKSNNESVFQKSYKILTEHTGDVKFIFDLEHDVTCLSAHKKVLSALSDVFNSMFNGLLKETDDIKIVDASPAAFTEFLQFFYENHVILTIPNIAQVLMLVDKYNVTTALPICVKFFEQNFTTKNILWGLSLALKFQMHELTKFCSKKIRQDIFTVINMFTIDGSGRGKLRSNPISQFIPEDELPAVFSFVYTLVQNTFNNSQFGGNDIISIKFIEQNPPSLIRVQENQSLRFCYRSSNKNQLLLLTDIFCQKIFHDIHVEISIRKKFKRVTLFRRQLKLSFCGNENHIKLPKLYISPNSVYVIDININPCIRLAHVNQLIIPSEYELTPNIKISFDDDDCQLISALGFTEIVVPDSDLKTPTMNGNGRNRGVF